MSKKESKEEKEEREYKAFVKKVAPRISEDMYMGQQIKFAHSAAQDAAEATLEKFDPGERYKKLINDDAAQDDYIKTFHKVLRKEVASRFKNKLGIDIEKDSPYLDALLETVGVPRYETIKELFKGMEEYNPHELETLLSQYHQRFVEQHMGTTAAEHAKTPTEKKYLLKHLDYFDDVDHTLVDDRTLQGILAQHVLRGRVSRREIPAKFRKKRKK